LTIDLFIKPALLFAAEAVAEQNDIWHNVTLWRVINLLIFVIIIVYVLRSKVRIGQVFDNRAASIVKELEQAKRDKEESQKRLKELEARLGRLDQEVAEIRAESERESAREEERIRQTASADAEKIRQTAQREIEGAMKAARGELRAFVADQSVALAEGIIRREIRSDDNTRMVNKYIDELNEVTK
jgi:F-type H+-transporting ATPase subunit b